MVRRMLAVVAVVVLTIVAGCRAQPTGPDATSTLQRDLEDPECADTVYQEGPNSRPASGSPTGVTATEDSRSSDECHVVVIWY